jgi:hypothetical protein
VSASATLPNTIQVRPSHLAGLLAAVAILTSVTTWSVSQVTTESNDSSSPTSGAVSSQGAAAAAYVDGVVALDAEQRAAIFGNLAPTQQSPQSVNALSPELQAINVDLKAIAEMARAEGLTGLSPTSLRSPIQPYADAIADLPPEQLIAMFGTVN